MKTCNIEDLAGLNVASLSITYNTDAADTAELSMKPEAYAELGWNVGERVELLHGGKKVFSGILPAREQCAVAGGQAETVSVMLVSDWYVLEQTVYARENGRGEVVFPRVSEEFSELREVAQNVYNWASGWRGSKLESAFECELSGRIPTPQSNGTNSCAQLMQDALQWTPNAVVVQRYGASGDVLKLTTPAEFEPLQLTEADMVASVSLQRRDDLCPPVCALVGGAHLVLPEGGDVRELGAFVYAVPLRRDGNMGPAGSAPASQKMVVRGVPIPSRYQFKRGVEEFKTSAVVAGSDTEKFLKQFFPQYAEWKNRLKAGACVVSVVPAEAINEGADAAADEDVQPTPANYGDPSKWAGGTGKGGIYVLTEGSFNASSNSRKNVRGLQWCKASLAVSVALLAKDLKDGEKPSVLELFPGRYVNDDGEAVYFANLTLDAVLINKRRKVYDPATNKLCMADEEWNEEQDAGEATASDYIAAMRAYYAATREVYTEGSIALLDDGTHAPHELTGRMVTLSGFRREWAGMKAVVRSVTWDPMRRKIELQVGPRAVLGFGEQLERRMMAKMTGENTARRQAVPFDVADDEAQEKNELEMGVSPSVTAGMGSHTSGHWRKPWTLYPVATNVKEDGTVEVEWWLQGGTLARGRNSFNVANTNRQITGGVPNDLGWTAGGGKPRVRFYRDARGAITYDIYQK